MATTDSRLGIIFLSNSLTDDLLTRVLLHELGHVIMFSYGLMDDIKYMVKRRYRYEMEEWICNLIADYSPEIYFIYDKITSKTKGVY